MRRVVITGMGIVSCLGNDQASVAAALREGRSGIRHVPEYAELGLRSQVAGVPEIDLEAQIERKQKRFMGDAAAYAHVAMRDAIARALGIGPGQVNVKAKTAEKLGPVGQGQSIEARAIGLIYR